MSNEPQDSIFHHLYVIVPTLIGSVAGQLFGPCCGGWREIARAEHACLGALGGCLIALSIRCALKLRRGKKLLQFTSMHAVEATVLIAILAMAGKHYVDTVRQSDSVYYGGFVWLQELTRGYVAGDE